jgi:hypothetical protein
MRSLKDFDAVERFKKLCLKEGEVKRLALLMSEHEFDLLVDFLEENKKEKTVSKLLSALSKDKGLGRQKRRFIPIIEAVFDRSKKCS